MRTDRLISDGGPPLRPSADGGALEPYLEPSTPALTAGRITLPRMGRPQAAGTQRRRSAHRTKPARRSMGSVGGAYDNAMCEGFFAMLECDLPERRRFVSQAEAKMANLAFSEDRYHPIRLHSLLGHRSPRACEYTKEVKHHGTLIDKALNTPRKRGSFRSKRDAPPECSSTCVVRRAPCAIPGQRRARV